MTDPLPDAPFATLLQYVRAFETLDADQVVPFYRLPCTFMAPQIHTVAADAAAARGVVTRLIEHAQIAGYARTGVCDGETRRLADDLALCTATFVRFGADGGEIGRFGATYLMCRHEERWKIAVAVAHHLRPTAERHEPAGEA